MGTGWWVIALLVLCGVCLWSPRAGRTLAESMAGILAVMIVMTLYLTMLVAAPMLVLSGLGLVTAPGAAARRARR